MGGSSNTAKFRKARDFLQRNAEDYDQAQANFVWPVLDGDFSWAIDWFDASAVGSADPALIVLDDNRKTVVSFDDMMRRSNQLARWLRGRGVAKGDVVLLMLGNQVELWESMLAIMKVGAVILPTTVALGTRDLAERIERADVKHVIANAGDAHKFDGIAAGVTRISVGFVKGWADLCDRRQELDTPVDRPPTKTSDPLLRYFTSGTTSRPKLVEHSQLSYPIGHLSTMYWLGLRPNDIHLNISSPGWAKHAWSCFFAPWIAQAAIAVFNYERFDAAALLSQLRKERITSFCAPPTVWRMLIKSDMSSRPEHLRELIAAGEPLNPEVIEQVRRSWGLTIRDGFGQTETSALVGNTPGSSVKLGSMGRPLPGIPVVLVDLKSGERVEEGEGEICLDLRRRPMNLMTGYVGQAAPDDDRYYHTGDIANVDADGYITYVGRTDDVFKASDYKISPFELESVLIQHPAVAEAAVVPAPDELRLAVPKAFVTLAPGFTPGRDVALQIMKYARDHLAPFQRIRKIEFGDLPKTISGKIRRVELRNRAGEPGSASAAKEWTEVDFPELRS